MAGYAGKECKGCGKNIWASDEVVVCASCGEAYHQICWKNMETCKKCGQKTGHEEGEKFDKFVDERLEKLQTEQEPPTHQAGNVSTPGAQIWPSAYYGDSDSLLFSNIGSKLKTVARIFTFLGIAAGILAAIAMSTIDDDLIVAGLLIGAIIAVVSWISSFALYGFGELISSSKKTEQILAEILRDRKK